MSEWPRGLNKNFQLLVVEVIKQVERTQLLLERPNDRLMWQIRRRDDYIDHLRHLIENTCFTYFRQHGNIQKAVANQIRSISVITTNLERIADFAVNIVGQTAHFNDPTFLNRYDCRPFFDAIIKSLRQVGHAAEEVDANRALSICEAEARIDRLYEDKFKRILFDMAVHENVANLVTALFIFHYLERMGDALLNIGEAILFSKMGERMKFEHYRSLGQALSEATSPDTPLHEVDVEGFWGTRSGCRIGKVSDLDPAFEPGGEVIYKEGERDKIRQERDKIEAWNALVPGLPPRVVEYQEGEAGRTATLLIEYLDGSTFQEIIINADRELLAEAMGNIQRTIRAVWTRTAEVTPTRPRFIDQLERRIGDVYNVHPHFTRHPQRIGGLQIPDFSVLLEQNRHLDEELAAPLSVFGHGDFNLDNIIYNREQKTVHYIDLHRSGAMDYALDMSVFLVSNYRLPVFDRTVRARLQAVINSFYDFSREFAAEHGDESFDARLSLGLARSFATSTRFEVDRGFAENMLWRASYLLERLSAHHGQPWSEFIMPQEVLLD